jgi:hypothetical protein
MALHAEKGASRAANDEHHNRTEKLCILHRSIFAHFQDSVATSAWRVGDDFVAD